jgi:hypothetical protein
MRSVIQFLRPAGVPSARPRAMPPTRLGRARIWERLSGAKLTQTFAHERFILMSSAVSIVEDVGLMLGWRKNRKTGRDDRAKTERDNRAWVVGEFRKRANSIRTSDPATQLAFSTILATSWKEFVAEHKSPSDFAHLPQDQQMSYYKKWIAMCQKLSNYNDTEKLIPAEMFVYYLAALMKNDRDFEIEAAEFLDAYAREGWQLT